MSVNKVILLGNITQDTEVKQTPNKKDVGTTAIALNETYTDAQGEVHEKTEFVNLVIWGKLAKTFENHVPKGTKVYVEGKMATRNWEDKETGKKIYRTEVVVHRMEFAGGIKSDGNSQASTKAKPKGTKTNPKDEEISVEDIPF